MVVNEPEIFECGSLAKLNELKALSFGALLAGVDTFVIFSANNELDNMEPKFSEFITLLVVGANLSPNTDVFSNTGNDVVVVLGGLDTTVKVTEADVDSGTVVETAAAFEIGCAETKFSENATNFDASEGIVLHSSCPDVAEFCMSTLGEAPTGNNTVFGSIVDNGLTEKMELVDKMVAGKDILTL